MHGRRTTRSIEPRTFISHSSARRLLSPYGLAGREGSDSVMRAPSRDRPPAAFELTNTNRLTPEAAAASAKSRVPHVSTRK